MKQISICIGIFIALSLSRFIPHPPNFTSLLALSFYVPVIFGLRYLPALLISFAITDFIIGYHSGTFFTWGSVFLIGLIANFFAKNITTRLIGALVGALIFFVISNFGVWVSGMYGLTIIGLLTCYTLALPFFTYSIISTTIFSLIIEILYKTYQSKFLKLQ